MQHLARIWSIVGGCQMFDKSEKYETVSEVTVEAADGRLTLSYIFPPVASRTNADRAIYYRWPTSPLILRM